MPRKAPRRRRQLDNSGLDFSKAKAAQAGNERIRAVWSQSGRHRLSSQIDTITLASAAAASQFACSVLQETGDGVKRTALLASLSVLARLQITP